VAKTRSNPSWLNIPLIIFSAFALYPILILIFNALKSRKDLALNPSGLPKEFIWSNFREAFNTSNFANHAANSLFLVLVTVTLVLILGGFAAYSLARLKPRGSGLVMVYMLTVSTLPIWLYIVPLFFLWRQVGLLNNYVGLILLYVALNSPFAIFLLRSYLVRIPREIEESAIMDGASKLTILTKVLLPISWTGFLTVGLVVALNVWNEFQVAFVFINDREKLPVATSFFAFLQEFGNDWTLTSAVGVLVIAPVLLLFFLFQRKFTDGLVQGSVKG
jgi:raffinose/stachyose/melibiose transport system permease protein